MQRADRAVALVKQMIDRAVDVERSMPRRSRRRRARFASVVVDPGMQDFTIRVADEVLRAPTSRTAAASFIQVSRHADLSGLGIIDRSLVRVAIPMARLLPGPVTSMVKRRIRWETSDVIIDGASAPFADHLSKRRSLGFRANVNVLGEAILSDAEAEKRLLMVLDRLGQSGVDYVSVKISAISARISPLAFDETVEHVAGALRRLYRAAQRSDASRGPAFVNLDMEEYRDLRLTTEVFRRVLDEPEFKTFRAGIVLQAYLPDSHQAAQQLCEWAAARYSGGGAPIKIRLVKGANLAMEQVEAEIRGWQLAPYESKAEVDASYKALLDTVCQPQFDGAVAVGVASHNLFDLGWAIGIRDERVRAGRPPAIEIEMLEGMANAHAQAVGELSGSVLLYTPVVESNDFAAAIAYLVRRLDENSSPENFLSTIFDISSQSPSFVREEIKFRQAVIDRGSISTAPRRSSPRTQLLGDRAGSLADPFVNAADSDFTLPANRQWIAEHLEAWVPPVDVIPVVIGGIAHVPDVIVQGYLGCSSGERYLIGHADLANVDAAVASAVEGCVTWPALDRMVRAQIVDRVGDVISDNRGQIITTMIHDAGKTVSEGDAEVSEAVDFARYYARQSLNLPDESGIDGVCSVPLGVVVITPPWNFPYAIPMGGILAALAAGNTVILKPAPQAVLTAWLIAQHCWAAGVPGDALQFVPCPDDEVGQRLITHPDVTAVILTGSYDTAAMFLGWRPGLRLHAETSGKNSLVITSSADVDLAVKDLVRSAFGHAGQKCSAASLAIVDATLYDQAEFRSRLRDAVLTLQVGSPTQLGTDVGPLVDAPSSALLRALTQLEPGEEWLVQPELVDGYDQLWSPGVRWGVRPGSWFASTECFGPVLGVIRSQGLDDAIRIQNSTAFGLTAGIHTLNDDEIDRWTNQVQAGNLYVNRGITGAIVQRQPFGGWKRSVVGPTVKAGGPRYVSTLRRWVDSAATPIHQVEQAFADWVATELDVEIDPTGLMAERNTQRFRSLPGGIALRIGGGACERDVAVARAAAAALDVRMVQSDASDETESMFCQRLADLSIDRLRILGDVSDDVRRAAHLAGVAVDDSQPVGLASIELPRWLREQSISRTMHRHGRLIPADGAVHGGENQARMVG